MNDDLRVSLYACKRILTKLQLINDAPTSRLHPGPKPPHYAEARIPEGVRTRDPIWSGGNNGNGSGHADHAPSKQFSLWAHYSHRMDRALRAKDASTLLKLAACATRDYERHVGNRTSIHATHESAVIELLRDCTGMPSVEASWWLDAPLKWVKRHRVLNGRDAELGEPTQAGSERDRKILALRARGMTQQAIADEVGLARSRVTQILAGG